MPSSRVVSASGMALLVLLAGLVAHTSQAFVPPIKTLRQLPGTTRTPVPVERIRRGALVMQSTASGAAAEASTSSSSETVLWLRGLSNTFDGTRYQFKDISLSLAKGQKVGLVGVNGCGKSTLLRCVGGVDKPESGQIETQRGLQVVYVEQEPAFPMGKLVRDVMFDPKGSKAMAAVREYQLASEALAEGTEEVYDRFQRASAQMDVSGGWEAETIANQVYTQLGVVELQDKLVENLSGGERKRLGLASALVRRPDVILFDEPTNHLDVEAIEWLEEHLRQRQVTAIVVTHDRYFLESVTSDIWELEDAVLYAHKARATATDGGNYESFLEAKANRLAVAEATRASDLKKLKKELEWMRKQPRARQAKSKSRQQSYHKLVKKTAKKDEVKGLSLEAAKARLGNFVLAFDDAKLRFEAAGGKKILDGFTYEFERGDRVGIVGPNGVGKSTFLSVLVGKQPLDSGEIMQGETVRFGYYNQQGMAFPEGVRLLDFVKDAAELSLASMESTVTTDAEGNVAISGPRMSGEALARDLLTRFSFPTQRWQDHVSKFSGGEKRRLQLMYILAQRPNFLVLDEPTNDLDLQTLAVLEEFLLEAYDGVLVIVSHDRRFVDKTTQHLFVFQGEGVVADFQGSFTDWLELEREERGAKPAAAAGSGGKGSASGAASKSSASASSSSESKPKRKGLSGKDKKELDGMEKAIAKLQKQKAEYEEKLASQTGAGYSQLAEWQKRTESIQEEIDAKEERWMELMELAEA